MIERYAPPTISDMVNQLYNGEKQSLNLFAKEKDWMDILKHQDWTSLKQLSLKSCQVNSTNVDLFLKIEWSKLEKLCLARNQLSSIDIERILNKNWVKLKKLSLWRNNLTNANNIWKKYFPQLQQLQLDYNNISFLGLSSIIGCPSSQIKILCLSNNKISSKGVKYLIKADFDKIQTLQVQNSEIGVQGMVFLLKGRWPQLKTLNISMNKITFDGFSSFSNDWKRLQNFIFSERRKNYKISYLLLFPVYWSNLQKFGQKQQDKCLAGFTVDINFVLKKHIKQF